MDAKDLQRRWKEVAKTCGAELSMACTANKPKWEKAQQAAEKMVAALISIVKIEALACDAWQGARQEPSSKPKPMLRVVR